jgi:hypothetical protein
LRTELSRLTARSDELRAALGETRMSATAQARVFVRSLVGRCGGYSRRGDKAVETAGHRARIIGTADGGRAGCPRRVVAHRNDDPANPIRVITLAYGTDGTQDYKVDRLAHAVENAWKAGIVVVVAGGNDGATGQLVNPAYDPYVITVGALGINNTRSDRSDDRVAEFTTRGNATRKVDVIAPRSLHRLAAGHRNGID